MSTIKAAILTGSKELGQLTSVQEIPYPKIKPNQILLRTVAVAANPTDWKHIFVEMGHKGDIAGSDASGIVEEVGSAVVGYSKGDVVSTFLHGNYSKERGGFAEFVVADPKTSINYGGASTAAFAEGALSPGDHPAGTINTFEAASSVTLGLVTIGVSFASGLRLDAANQKNNRNDYILVWGGATATGTLAIQVAKEIYNLKVITTASSKHHAFLKSIGADVVVDYHATDAVEQIRRAGGASIKYALDTVASEDTFQQVYAATRDSGDVVLDSLLFLGEKNITPDGRTGKVRYVQTTLAYVADGSELDFGGTLIKLSPEQIEKYTQFWTELLPSHIRNIKHTKLKVLPKGLESANEALALLKEDKVSGEKLVFRI